MDYFLHAVGLTKVILLLLYAADVEVIQKYPTEKKVQRQRDNKCSPNMLHWVSTKNYG